MNRPVRRFLVLGLDGATFDLLDPLMASGELPFLKSLIERGARAPLTSVYPPKTIPAWYSFATGLDPGSLGIFGFTEPDGGPGKSRIVQTFRPAEAFWDRLSRQGLRVGVLNFPMRAAYPLNGFLIPGMLSDHPPTYPADARERLEAELGEPYLSELPAYRGAERSSWMAQATHGVEQRGRAAKILCDQYRPDFLFVLFRETDRVQHQHWGELSGPHPKIGEDLLAFWRSVDATCQQVDQSFRALGEPTTTIVISDHGHGAACSDFFTNRWLHQEGYLTFKDGGDSFRRRLLSRVLLASDRFGPTRAVLRPVADRLRGGDKPNRVGQWLSGEASFEGMASRIDWKRTVAFSYPVPEGIYLNRYNPELTAQRKAEVLGEIRGKLERYPDARIEVLDPKEIYQGQNLAQAPSLLIRVDDLRTELRMDFSYAKPMLKERPGFFYGTGVHRMNGVFVASGPDVREGPLDGPVSLLDIAPLVLSGMGVDVPVSMAHRSLVNRIGLAS